MEGQQNPCCAGVEKYWRERMKQLRGVSHLLERIEHLERGEHMEVKKRADKFMEAEAAQSNKVMELEQELADEIGMREVIAREVQDLRQENARLRQILWRIKRHCCLCSNCLIVAQQALE